jgi:hypothetical protein
MNMTKNILDDIMVISEVAEATGTTASNIRHLIGRGRIPQFYYRLKKSSYDKKGAYVFHKSFIEYHKKNLSLTQEK